MCMLQDVGPECLYMYVCMYVYKSGNCACKGALLYFRVKLSSRKVDLIRRPVGWDKDAWSGSNCCRLWGEDHTVARVSLLCCCTVRMLPIIWTRLGTAEVLSSVVIIVLVTWWNVHRVTRCVHRFLRDELRSSVRACVVYALYGESDKTKALSPV
jgi:hypothetical protein